MKEGGEAAISDQSPLSTEETGGGGQGVHLPANCDVRNTAESVKKKENMLTRWKGRLGEPPFYARPDENHGLRGEMGGRRVGVSSWPQTQSLTSGGATAPYCHISARWSTAEVQGRLLRTKHGNIETLSDK